MQVFGIDNVMVVDSADLQARQRETIEVSATYSHVILIVSRLLPFGWYPRELEARPEKGGQELKNMAPRSSGRCQDGVRSAAHLENRCFGTLGCETFCFLHVALIRSMTGVTDDEH